MALVTATTSCVFVSFQHETSAWAVRGYGHIWLFRVLFCFFSTFCISMAIFQTEMQPGEASPGPPGASGYKMVRGNSPVVQ